MRRKLGSSSSHYYVPEEVISDILLRLPVEDLGRFKYVSKSWFSLISSPSFVKAILARTHRNIEQEEEIIIQTISKPPAQSSISISSSDSVVEFNHLSISSQSMISFQEELKPIKFQSAPSGKSLSVMSCCHGLLLVSDEDENRTSAGDQLFVSNPTIGQFVALPPTKHRGLAWKLIHDTCMDKYKVYVIRKCKLIVLTQGETNWTELVDIPFTFCRGVSHLAVLSQLVLMNNELHWLTIDYEQELFYSLFSINIQTGEFTRTKVPLTIVSPDAEIDGKPPDYELTEFQQSVMITMVFHTKIQMFRLEDRAQCRWRNYYNENLLTIFYQHTSAPPIVPDNLFSTEFFILLVDDPDIRAKSKMFLRCHDTLLFCYLNQKRWRPIGSISKDQILQRTCIRHYKSLVSWL